MSTKICSWLHSIRLIIPTNWTVPRGVVRQPQRSSWRLRVQYGLRTAYWDPGEFQGKHSELPLYTLANGEYLVGAQVGGHLGMLTVLDRSLNPGKGEPSIHRYSQTIRMLHSQQSQRVHTSTNAILILNFWCRRKDSFCWWVKWEEGVQFEVCRVIEEIAKKRKKKRKGEM